MTMNFTYEVHLVADGKFGTQERVCSVVNYSMSFYLIQFVMVIATYWHISS